MKKESINPVKVSQDCVETQRSYNLLLSVGNQRAEAVCPICESPRCAELTSTNLRFVEKGEGYTQQPHCISVCDTALREEWEAVRAKIRNNVDRWFDEYDWWGVKGQKGVL